MVKKKVCIKQYICTNLFLCFLVREMNSWPLMLILWYAGRRREEPRPPSSLCGTLLCRRGRVWKKKKVTKQNRKGGRESSASRQKHFLCCTSCGWSQRSTSWSHCSAFFLPTSPKLLPSFLPSRAGDDALSSLLRCHWPAAPSVSSVPRGYCCDVTSSRQHHWASPPSPMGSITGLQRWGVGGVSHGGTVRRCKAEPPRLPLSTPQQRSLTED